MKVWVDMTASAHVLVFRPLIALLSERGDEVEITAREYAQTLQLLELHGLEATVIGRHGGRSRLGKGRSLFSRLHALRKWARPRMISIIGLNTSTWAEAVMSIQTLTPLAAFRSRPAKPGSAKG